MNPKHKGALAELKATTWLLQQGMEVFRNVSAFGEVDIIIRDPQSGDLKQVDVTMGTYYTKKDGGLSISFNKKVTRPDGVIVLVLMPDDKFIWSDER
jgi:Holliday junction resolvase-like predicted endonuclease